MLSELPPELLSVILTHLAEARSWTPLSRRFKLRSCLERLDAMHCASQVSTAWRSAVCSWAHRNEHRPVKASSRRRMERMFHGAFRSASADEYRKLVLRKIARGLDEQTAWRKLARGLDEETAIEQADVRLEGMLRGLCALVGVAPSAFRRAVGWHWDKEGAYPPLVELMAMPPLEFLHGKTPLEFFELLLRIGRGHLNAEYIEYGRGHPYYEYIEYTDQLDLVIPTEHPGVAPLTCIPFVALPLVLRVRMRDAGLVQSAREAVDGVVVEDAATGEMHVHEQPPTGPPQPMLQNGAPVTPGMLGPDGQLEGGGGVTIVQGGEAAAGGAPAGAAPVAETAARPLDMLDVLEGVKRVFTYMRSISSRIFSEDSVSSCVASARHG